LPGSFKAHGCESVGFSFGPRLGGASLELRRALYR